MSNDPKAIGDATMTIGGVDMQVRVCAAQIPQFSFDPVAPEGDRTVVWPPLPESVTFTTTEDVLGDTKRFFDTMLESAARDRAFDPWADTHRLNDLGRAPNRQRDIAEFECRLVMRGTPLVVTEAMGRELEAIEFDQELYTATDTPFGPAVSAARRKCDYVVVVGGGAPRGVASLVPLADVMPRQFAVANSGCQDRLRDRWGRLKR